MNIDLRLGDCLEVLKTIPDNSIDSIVTDPPYGIGFMNKEWDNPTKHKELIEREQKRSEERFSEGKSPVKGGFSKGVQPGLPIGGATEGKWFQQWCELWAVECLRILKPGGHILSFSAPRTYHRMATAFEDAGFQIRDQLMWVFGSGFPKSHNIGKAIDKRGGESIGWFGDWLKEWREENNIPQSKIAELFPSKSGGLTGCVSNWELGNNLPTNEQFNLICETFDLPFKSLEEAEREYIGTKTSGIGKAFTKDGWGSGHDEVEITKGNSDWEGWGTALKPAHEPIVMARKPLSEKSIAENVLKHGTGGINIDGSRIGMKQGDKMDIRRYNEYHDTFSSYEEGESPKGKEYIVNEPHEGGRFPANIIFDEEAGQLLDEQSGIKKSSKRSSEYNKDTEYTNTYTPAKSDYRDDNTYGDKGGASRYFFTPNGSHFDFFNYIYLLCGNILEKEQGAGILNGVILEVEKCLVNHEQFILGNKLTEQFQKDMKSTISILIERMTELKTYNFYQRVNIDYYTQNFVKTIEKLMELNVEDAKIAENINHLKIIIQELLEHLGDIVKLVPSQNYKNGEDKIKNITTNITNNIENPTKFKYCPKAAKKDRNEGDVSNLHPTVKPTDLMRYLINLVTPPNGTILDPFMGSGSTGKAAVRCGVNFIGIEKEQEYMDIASARIEHEKNKPVQQELFKKK